MGTGWATFGTSARPLASCGPPTTGRGRLVEPAPERDVELRSQIHEVALVWSQYGYCRIMAELRRRGVVANHKHVLRLMREDNLLYLRERRYAISTDSEHDLPVYPNPAATLEVTGPDRLWVAA